MYLKISFIEKCMLKCFYNLKYIILRKFLYLGKNIIWFSYQMNKILKYILVFDSLKNFNNISIKLAY